LQADFGAGIELLCNGANLGFTGGNNTGIRHALAQGADFILLLNNDTIVAPDFLPPLLRRLEANPQIGVVTAKIFYMHDPTLLWAAGGELNLWLGRARNRGAGQRDAGQYDIAESVGYVTGCCLLARRAVFEQAGLLDDDYFTYFEDADWCLRARKVGWQCWYEPQSHIWHWAGAANKRGPRSAQTGSTSASLYYYVTRNNLWFLRRHAPPLALPSALLAFFVRHMALYTVVFLALRRWAKLRALWRGWRDGWRGPARQRPLTGEPAIGEGA
jgi:GT2 family glycosyltransferase